MGLNFDLTTQSLIQTVYYYKFTSWIRTSSGSLRKIAAQMQKVGIFNEKITM